MYQSGRKLLLQTREGISKLERFESAAVTSSSSSSYSSSSPPPLPPNPSLGIGLDSPEIAFSIEKDIAQIRSMCSDMDRLCRSVASKGQYDLWRRKVGQVAAEVDFLKGSLDRLSLRQQKWMQEAKERAELIERVNAQRKALDILNTVGLSNHVLKLVERQHRVDKWIAYNGMIATVVVVYLFWRWTH